MVRIERSVALSVAVFCFLCRGQVFIAQRYFDLRKAEEAVAFLCETYNLAEELNDLAGRLDPKNEKRLGNFKNAALNVISLMSQAQHNKTPRTTRASVPKEHREANGVQDDFGVFDADDIQCISKEMDYKISFIVFGVCTAEMYYIIILTIHLTASVPSLGVKY